MNHITFIVGNGLDLSLGMKTSYADFYKYLKNKNLDNGIYKAINDNPDTWSYFEYEFGNYTRYLDDIDKAKLKKESLKLHDEFEEIKEELAKYLLEEDSKIKKDDFKLKLSKDGFYKELKNGPIESIRGLFSNQPFVFDFITLNYTKVIDKIISANQNWYLNHYDIKLGKTHYLHGDLIEDMTMGVSDSSQISASLDGNERDDFVKPLLIDSMNDGRIKIAQNIIQASKVIVLFGTSLGDTDRYLWQIILTWLVKNPDRYIILHKYDLNYTDSVRRSPRRKKMIVSAVQDNILKHLETDDSLKEILRKRIFVIHNTEELFKKVYVKQQNNTINLN